MESNKRDIAPLSELFLLLPEHKRIIQGESSRIGVEGESAGLRRSATLLSIALVTYLAAAMILMILNMNSQPLIIILAAIIPALVIAGFLFLVIRRYQCKQKLETIGILLPGHVTDAKGDKAITSNGVKMALRLRYEFTSLKGERIEREEAQLRDELNELPQIGTPVAVLYADNDCFRVL